MADEMQIAGPIEIRDNSAERVAYELMRLISSKENPTHGSDCVAKKASNRLYYLNLYAECLNVVKGYEVPQSDSSQG